MADRIKGLTIEINGDVTGLSSALKTVNKEISACQTNLRDVDRALKLDPGNVELLTVKQKALNDAVDSAKEKLAKEKQALEQLKQSDGFDENSRQAKDLETQIALDEAALKQLTNEAKNFGSVGQQQFAAAGEKLKAVGETMSRTGQTLTTNVTAPIVALGTAAVKTTADFDTSMSKVAAISGATGEDFDALRTKAREMGRDTKFSASEAADAMTYMAMAGWKTDDMLNGLSGIMNLAAASGEDLATTSDIVTDALTAFGLKAEDSAHFADILAAASNNSNTNVSMLGESFKYVAPVAGAMGYKAEDVAVALGLMANAGIKASQGGTSLRNILKNLAAPTDKVQVAMDRLGISLDDGHGNMLSFREVMDQLRGSLGNIKIPVEELNQRVNELDESYANGEITEKEYNKELDALMERAYGAEGALKAQYAATIAGSNGMSGLLAIINTAPAEYDALTQSIDNCDGTAEKMSEIMQNNLSGQLTNIMSKLSELAISFGDILMPTIRKVAEKIGELIDWLNNLDDDTKEMIATCATVVAAVGPVLLIAGKLVTGVGAVISAISTCSGAFSAIAGLLTGPVASALGAVAGVLSGPVVAAIAAAVAAGILIYKNWDTICEYARKLKEQLVAVFENIKTALSNAWESIKSTASNAWNAVKTTISSVWDGIKSAVGNAVNNVKSAVDKGWNAIKTAASTAWNAVKTTISGVWDGIKSAVGNAVNNVKSAIDKGWNTIKSAASTAWSNVKTTIGNAWDGIKTAVGNASGSVRSGLDTTWSNIKSATGNAWSGIKSTISSAWDGIRSVASSAVSTVSSTVSNVWNGILSKTTSIWGSIKSAISSAMDSAKSIVSSAIEKIKGFFNFKWELPKLKMPHFSIKGSFSLSPPSVPTLSVDWYKKAMGNGMILDSPTIFGAMDGKLLAGGEAGSEAVVGTRSLMTMIQRAVTAAGTTSYGDVNITVYGAQGQNVSELADIIAERINTSVRRRGAAFA